MLHKGALLLNKIDLNLFTVENPTPLLVAILSISKQVKVTEVDITEFIPLPRLLNVFHLVYFFSKVPIYSESGVTTVLKGTFREERSR